jgi:hypothetical protein
VRWCVPAIVLLCVAATGCSSGASAATGRRFADATAVARQADCDYEAAAPPADVAPRPASYGRCGYGPETVAVLVFDAEGAADRAFSDVACRRDPHARRRWFARGPNWFATSADGSHGVRTIAAATGARVIDHGC